MRVAIDTTYTRRAPLSGTGIYQRRIVAALAELGVDALAVANARRPPPAGGGLGSVRNLLIDVAWSALALPRRARRARVDVLHHAPPALSPAAGMPQVVTVLDLAFERLPQHFDARFRAYAHHAHRLAARHAAAVICISETTAEDVRGRWRVDPGRIVVAPLGPGQDLPCVTRAEQPRHFLYVGDAEPRKDLGTLLDAYARYRRRSRHPLALVLAGRARASGEGVRVSASPAAAELAALYADAVALVHPSLYEGFGLTPLEAMRLGTPVIAARSPGVAEVCGEAAAYVPPSDPERLAHAMRELAGDRDRRAELARRGRERAEAFSWAGCAERHRAAYSLALGRPSR